jgi:hypothetical protein
MNCSAVACDEGLDAPMGDIVIITAVSRILRKKGDRHLSFFTILAQILRCEAV